MPDEAPVISATGLVSTAFNRPALAGLSISMDHNIRILSPPMADTMEPDRRSFTFVGSMPYLRALRACKLCLPRICLTFRTPVPT